MIILLRRLHSWAGFILALIIILVSITGVMLVWKKQYLWLTEPATRTELRINPASATQLVLSAEQHFGKNNILMISYGVENLALHKVWLGNQNYAYLDNDGNLIDQWHANGRIEELIYDLHHRLLLENTGLLIAGLSALIILGLMPVGLTVWWPQRRKFSWKIWLRHLSRPYLLASHRNLGVITALPIALALITGIMLTFPNESRTVLVDPFSQSDSYNALFEKNLDDLSGREQAEYLAVFKRAQASFPGAVIRSISLPSLRSEHLVIGMQKPADWHQSGLHRVYIDAKEGYMDMRLDASELPVGEKLYNASYPLHTGKTDSLIYQIFVTVIGACLFLLALIGFSSFIQKLIKKISN